MISEKLSNIPILAPFAAAVLAMNAAKYGIKPTQMKKLLSQVTSEFMPALNKKPAISHSMAEIMKFKVAIVQ